MKSSRQTIRTSVRPRDNLLDRLQHRVGAEGLRDELHALVLQFVVPKPDTHPKHIQRSAEVRSD